MKGLRITFAGVLVAATLSGSCFGYDKNDPYDVDHRPHLPKLSRLDNPDNPWDWLPRVRLASVQVSPHGQIEQIVLAAGLDYPDNSWGLLPRTKMARGPVNPDTGEFDPYIQVANGPGDDPEGFLPYVRVVKSPEQDGNPWEFLPTVRVQGSRVPQLLLILCDGQRPLTCPNQPGYISADPTENGIICNYQNGEAIPRSCDISI